jgi:hypothetical protein
MKRAQLSRGAVLIAALLLCAIIAISLVSYNNLATTALSSAQRSVLALTTVNVAEMGIEQAMASFYQVSIGTSTATAWSGWTLDSGANEARRTYPTAATYFDLGANARAQVKIYVQSYTGTGSPVIVAKAILQPATGQAVLKYLKLTLAQRSLWSFGLVGKQSVQLNSNATADSWISDSDSNPSTAGVAYAAGLRRDNAAVGTVSATNGALALDSNASIYGTANTGGGNVTTNSNVRIYGASSPASPKVDTSRIHKDFTFTFPAITVPTGDVVNTVSSSWRGGTSGSPQVVPAPTDRVASDGKYYYSFGSGVNINMDSNKVISITQPVVLLFASHSGVSTLHTSSNANINVTAGKTVDIYTNGNIALDSNNSINIGNDASKLAIYGTNATSQSFVLSSNVSIYGTIYAPTASFQIDSNCKLYGVVIANTIQMDSNAAFHYDESLAGAGSGSGFRVTEWVELQSATERTTYEPKFSF